MAVLNPSTAQTGGTPGDPVSRLLWVDRSGHVTGQLGDPARYWTMALSPDGTRAAVNKDEFIWSLDARTNLKTKVAAAVLGTWMPNSQEVAFVDDNAIWTAAATGEGARRKLIAFADRPGSLLAVASDGKLAAVLQRTESRHQAILLMKISDGTAKPLVSGDFDAKHAQFSKSGRWLAYSSNQTGRLEIYARPIDGSRSAVQLSVDGGEQPCWGANDKEVFFLSPTDEIVAADTTSLQTSGTVTLRKVLFRMVTNDIVREAYPAFAVSPDGQKFLINVPAAPEPLTLIQLPASPRMTRR
jgi:hypothetical protein